METLHLPEDLIWDGKMEPFSPSSELFSLSNTEESWILDDNFVKENLFLNVESSEDLFEQSIIDGELLYEFEYDLNDEDVKVKEQWNDLKINPSQLVDFSTGVPSMVQPTPVIKVPNAFDIVMDLGNFYDNSELTQLTPPQTPPERSIEIKEHFDYFTKENQNQQMNLLNMGAGNAAASPAYSSDSLQDSSSEIGTQIVDEILRTRAKDLPDWINYDDCYSSSVSSPQSNDEDWLGNNDSSSMCSSSESSVTPLGKKAIKTENNLKKRTRPYGRNVEDKKSRKKEQNKNAATRYRQKKKQEMSEVLDEEKQLIGVNDNLSSQVADLNREVKYLKTLIREFYKDKV